MSDGNFVILMYLIALIMKPILSLAFFFMVVDYAVNRVTDRKRVYVTAEGIQKTTYFASWTVKLFVVSLILWGIPIVLLFGPALF